MSKRGRDAEFCAHLARSVRQLGGLRGEAHQSGAAATLRRSRGPSIVDASASRFLHDDPIEVAEILAQRILRFEEYRLLFDLAYPGEEPTFAHLARAIVHFRQELWSHAESDWDLRDEFPVSLATLAGAELFFGDAGCARCHSGADFGGDEFFNIGVPQIGPGFAPMMPDGTTDLRPGLDEGRFNTTGNAEDRFAFRVPTLRNVHMTGPWMHNGAYASLEAGHRPLARVPRRAGRGARTHQLA